MPLPVRTSPAPRGDERPVRPTTAALGARRRSREIDPRGRLIEQGSVQLDGQKLRDPKATLRLRAGQILRLDKTRAVRIG